MEREINCNTRGKSVAPPRYRSLLSPPFRNQVVRSALRLVIKEKRKIIQPALMLPVRVQFLNAAASLRAKLTAKFHIRIFSA
jgi:hypothetical protein